jgi:hypothetical protein
VEHFTTGGWARLILLARISRVKVHGKNINSFVLISE